MLLCIMIRENGEEVCRSEYDYRQPATLNSGLSLLRFHRVVNFY